jgi:membrane protein DedA with SNARE-associated domain
VALEIMERGLNFDTLNYEYKGFKVMYSFVGSIVWALIYFCVGFYFE